MKSTLKYILVLPVFFIATFCKTTNKDLQTDNFTIKESYQTERNESDNVDAPSFWKSGSNAGWLISTAKETDKLLIHNASNGALIKTIGKSGTGELEFERPNGISIIDSLIFVVERDNKRVQVLGLPDFNFINIFAENDLRKPYGIYIQKMDSSYKVFVTDNYEFAEDVIPADSLLNERVLIYNFTFVNSIANVELVQKFGENSGVGRLKIVESIYGDSEFNNLLIAEEKEDETCVKVYDLHGKFKNRTIGKGLFKYQVEGITLYKTKNNDGFWIITDQDLSDNTFHIFSRKEFNHLGSFKNPKTTNTDGIWLTQESFEGFPQGAFFAVHNDGNVTAIDLNLILEKFIKRN